MKTVLQKTKLYFPPARSKLVERPRLLERLDALKSPNHRIGLVSAPAGSGKTTLVIQWLASQPAWRAAWVSLDVRDNQPASFFTYFIAALQAIYPETGKEALELLQLPGVNLEELVTLLTNDLAEAPSPFIVVLDDFHHITNPPLCQAIDLFVDAQPAMMRLMLLTREDPSLQLARHRANDELVELRQEDLCFTLPEAIAFLNQCMRLGLIPSQVEQLEVRTEGWIAGLQMAALSLQHSTDIDRFIRDFSGSHRFILDYLMEEVLSHQPLEVQSFLLETSILERMCAGLCAAVTQKTVKASQKLLEDLTRANLFITSLDEDRCWYRYHHLFNDLLLARLLGDEPERARQLSRRASDWFEQNGDPRLAVEYAFKAQDNRRAAHLIEVHFADRWQLADLEFCFLVFKLPMEIVVERPSLCLDISWLHILSGQFSRVVPYLAAAEHRLSNPSRIPESADDTNRAFATTIRAFMEDFQNQHVEVGDALKQTFAAIPEASSAMHNSVAVLLGTICYMEADFDNAIRYCRYALENDKRLDGTIAIPISVMRMVWALQAQGKLHQAVELIAEHEAYIRQRGNRRYYISGVLNLMWGEILLEWNRLDEAEAQVRLGLRLLEDWPVPQSFCIGMGLLARLQLVMGDLAGARTTLQKVDELYHVEEFHPAFVQRFEIAQVCLWIAEQNVEALGTFVRKVSPLTTSDPAFRIEVPLVNLCRAWIALGRSDEALGLLKRLYAAAEGRAGSQITILTLLVAAQSDQPEKARVTLDEALRLAQTEGYLRSFLDAGEPMRRALDSWLLHSTSATPTSLRAYARCLLSALNYPNNTIREKTGAATVLPEPLTPRELDVLRLLVTGCSDRQIAEELILARGTVKYYVHGILQKLDVHSRTQAIARARELDLV